MLDFLYDVVVGVGGVGIVIYVWDSVFIIKVSNLV